jgi:hypothetical protein
VKEREERGGKREGGKKNRKVIERWWLREFERGNEIVAPMSKSRK